MTSSQHNYLLMRAALEQFGKSRIELDAASFAKADLLACKALTLQQAVLGSAQASSIVIADSELEQAFLQLKQRFESENSFKKALEDNGLTKQGLKQALKVELICEAVLTLICKEIPAVTEQDAEAYYLANPQKFNQPERRKASHILITVNPQFAENTESEVKKRIEKIQDEMASQTFAWLAKRYSECPSAMQDGELGWVAQGMLFPELDHALFQMTADEISAPIATEIGYHLLYCQAVQPAHTVPFETACAQIQQQLFQKKIERHQKRWLHQLTQTACETLPN